MVWKERLLEMDDLPVILEWYNDEELHNIADIKPFKRYTIEVLREYWTEKLSRSYASYHVIVVKDEVIGRVGLKKTKYDDTYVMEYSILIGVSNLYSKGIGTEITKYFINKSFLDPDIEAVLLQVREDNKRAIRCYEKAGFKKIKSYIENEVKVYEMIKVKKEETVSKEKNATNKNLPYIDLYRELLETGKTHTHDIELLQKINDKNNYKDEVIKFIEKI